MERQETRGGGDLQSPPDNVFQATLTSVLNWDCKRERTVSNKDS